MQLTGVLQVIRYSDTAVRARLEGQGVREGRLLVLTDNRSGEVSELLADLDRRQSRGRNVEIFSLLLEELNRSVSVYHHMASGGVGY